MAAGWRFVVSRRDQREPDDHHVGTAHKRNTGGSWDYPRPAEDEPPGPPGRHPLGMRDNLAPGEQP